MSPEHLAQPFNRIIALPPTCPFGPPVQQAGRRAAGAQRSSLSTPAHQTRKRLPPAIGGDPATHPRRPPCPPPPRPLCAAGVEKFVGGGGAGPRGGGGVWVGRPRGGRNWRDAGWKRS